MECFSETATRFKPEGGGGSLRHFIGDSIRVFPLQEGRHRVLSGARLVEIGFLSLGKEANPCQAGELSASAAFHRRTPSAGPIRSSTK